MKTGSVKANSYLLNRKTSFEKTVMIKKFLPYVIAN